MEIEYRSKHLRKICEEERIAKSELGAPCAKKLQTRFADMCAAQYVSELIAGDPHPLKGERKGQFAVSLMDGKRLVFEPAHNPIPLKEDSGIDWSKVSRVRIMEILDYHD